MPLITKGKVITGDDIFKEQEAVDISAGRKLKKKVVTKLEQEKKRIEADGHTVIVDGVERTVSAKTKALIDQLLIIGK